MIGDCGRCIHFERCSVWHKEFIGKPLKVESLCDDFKNKADFVEVVRCKDCTFRQPIDESQYTFKGKPAMVCIVHSRAVAEDGYCSYGERRDT